MIVDQTTILDYQFIINYEKVKLLNNELLNYIEENKFDLGFDKAFANSGMRIIKHGGLYNDVIKSLKKYVTETTIVNKSLDLFEQTGKGILIANGHDWDECKTFGHNILNIYNHLTENDRIRLISIIGETYAIENEEQFLTYLSKFTQVRDLDGNMTRLLANISTRYPGENYSQYSIKDIKFIAQVSSGLFEIYQTYMPDKYKKMYNYEGKVLQDVLDNTPSMSINHGCII